MVRSKPAARSHCGARSSPHAAAQEQLHRTRCTAGASWKLGWGLAYRDPPRTVTQLSAPFRRGAQRRQGCSRTDPGEGPQLTTREARRKPGPMRSADPISSLFQLLTPGGKGGGEASSPSQAPERSGFFSKTKKVLRRHQRNEKICEPTSCILTQIVNFKKKTRLAEALRFF